MSGAFGELGSLLKQAQQMQRDLDKVREELKSRTVEGLAGGGAVKVIVTGDRQVTRVEIDRELLNKPDKAMLEDLLLIALRDGLGRASKMSAEALGRVTGGINLPGLF
jgi:DNA-binding YbaB/EbfC family protein